MNHSCTAASVPRHDLYCIIHKALRHYMFDTLERVGRLDADSPADMASVLDQVDDMLATLRDHATREDDHVHAAIEARQPGATTDIGVKHLNLHFAIDALYEQSLALRHAGPADRSRLAQQLYRLIALFVAETLQHMHLEETTNNALLWLYCGDEELRAIEQGILAGLGPEQRRKLLLWMAASVTPAELARLLDDMRHDMPAGAFAELLALVREKLDDARGRFLDPLLKMSAALDGVRPADVAMVALQ